MRPGFEKICMEIAASVSKRSTCLRTSSQGDLMQVGCVVVTPDYRKILSWGYNGNAAGLPNKCDSTEPGACGCLHAEENATISCDSPRAMEKVVFCTHLPCPMCAKRLIQLGGVKKVFYLTDYRIRTGLSFFDAVGIEHEHLEA